MLLATESKVEFDKLRDELLQDLQPQDAIERHYAEDIAYLTWEIRRYREVKAGIINAALFQAVHRILYEFLPRDHADFLQERPAVDHLARGWFDDKRKRKPR